ncbi:hypothetical protein Acr_00g0044300 [Actinidia rufa]|uniref:Uncharacterized protein n=1 Tax=Actinidia rufa TaxID=165716 RepID=A0A7J0DIX6_9ERIC|nr:hypothetical protein Acr_00g0044300 [Actinidia rufa]
MVSSAAPHPGPFYCRGGFEIIGGCGSSLSNMHPHSCGVRALEKFKAAHGIPADVTIEHPGPNNIPHIVAKRPDRIPVRTWLIHQPLVVPQTQRKSARQFNNKFKFCYDDYKEAIRAANNRQESRDVEALIEYEPYYRHKIPRSPRASMPRKRKGKEPLVGTPKRLRKETSSVGAVELWEPNFSTFMLPSDSTALTEESWDLMRNLLVMQHFQSLQRAMATSNRMAKYSAELKQAKKKMEANANKAKLALANLAAYGLVYERVFTQGANRVGENYSRQVAEVRFESFLVDIEAADHAEEVRRTVAKAPRE